MTTSHILHGVSFAFLAAVLIHDEVSTIRDLKNSYGRDWLEAYFSCGHSWTMNAKCKKANEILQDHFFSKAIAAMIWLAVELTFLHLGW